MMSYSVQTLLKVVSFGANFIERTSKRAPTFLIKDPSINGIDLEAVHSHKVIDAWNFRELWFRDSSEKKECFAKPNLFQMSLVSIFSDYLLYGKLFLAFEMFP